MAKPRESYPETATHGVSKDRSTEDGERAVRESLSQHGDALANLLNNTDEFENVLTTAILIVASADEPELDHITESTANLVDAADGVSTAEAAELATDVGQNADDLSASLETILEIQRDGHLDDLMAIAAAFAESLSAEEVEELATLLEDGGADIVDALTAVIELQQEDHLEDLIDLAETFSALDVEQETIEGLNNVLAAVGEAQRDSQPIGLFGLLAQLLNRDARAGFGYLVSILKAQGRRVREQ